MVLVSDKPARIEKLSRIWAVIVYEGKKWYSVDPSEVVCHHMSYVRTDDQMYRKIGFCGKRA